MGAFGCALIAKSQYKEGKESTLLDEQGLNNIKLDTTVKRCKGCLNKCLLTINKFSENEIFISGNRCENGAFLNGDKSIKKEKTNVLVIYHKIVKNTKKKGKTIDKRKETDTVPEK